MKKILTVLFFACMIVTVRAQADRTKVLQKLEQNQPAEQNSAQTATLKSAARLFGAKDDLTSVIMIIPSGSVVTVLDSDSTYYLVRFEEYDGYILKRQATISKSAIPENKNVSTETTVPENNQVQENRPVQQNQVSKFTYLENKYGASMAARLNAGKIWKGMTAEMAKDSWGSPQKINRVISGNTMKEEWIYRSTWLYFQDDVLTSWGPVR